MKYKAGDRVKIKSLDWYNENKDEYGYVRCTDFLFTPEHSKYCGCKFTVSHITTFRIPSYVMVGNGHEWTDEMIECKVEEDCNLVQVDDIPDAIQIKLSSACSHNGFYGYSDSEGNETSEWNLPEGYRFVDENGNVINATKIVLEKKKKEYPKTFEECCKILGLLNVDLCFNADYRSFDASKEQWKRLGLMNQFYQLLICRDAYWKIAGEEMGLGKPWKPDWEDESDKFTIGYFYNDIDTDIIRNYESRTFAFPTKEMRDAFKENFDSDIEICKELL